MNEIIIIITIISIINTIINNNNNNNNNNSNYHYYYHYHYYYYHAHMLLRRSPCSHGAWNGVFLCIFALYDREGFIHWVWTSQKVQSKMRPPISAFRVQRQLRGTELR